MVPGAEARGLVAPRMAVVKPSAFEPNQRIGGNLLRPVLTTSLPSQTMATTGPLSMSSSMSVYLNMCCWREQLTSDEALEERLLREVLVVGFEVLLGGRAHLHGNELEAVRISTMCELVSSLGIRTHGSRSERGWGQRVHAGSDVSPQGSMA